MTKIDKAIAIHHRLLRERFDSELASAKMADLIAEMVAHMDAASVRAVATSGGPRLAEPFISLEE